jgi:4'-phosphopantetheinyl transferase
MPLIFHTDIQPQGQYGIWQTKESDEFFISELDLYPDEIIELQILKSRKKTEWLSSRYLLHQLSGRTRRGACLKDRYGKPYLEGSDHFISMSHTLDLAAVIASQNPVGIDIQYLVEKIQRISTKFVRDDEFLFIPEVDRILYFHAIWGAKESMYKAYGKKELDFKNHMTVSPFVFYPDGFYFDGEIKKNDFIRKYRLFCSQTANIILVYASEQ